MEALYFKQVFCIRICIYPIIFFQTACIDCEAV